MEQSKAMIGWYSATASEGLGTVVWSTPDGKEVHITCALDEGSVYHWPDAVRIGEVVNYVRGSLKAAGEYR